MTLSQTHAELCLTVLLFWAGGGGCDGAWQAGAVPSNPAGLHCPAGNQLCAPLEPAATPSQQGPCS